MDKKDKTCYIFNDGLIKEESKQTSDMYYNDKIKYGPQQPLDPHQEIQYYKQLIKKEESSQFFKDNYEMEKQPCNCPPEPPCHCPPGPPGPQGPKGCQGEKGDRGPKGDKGDKGDVGPQGPKGCQGEKGDRGPKGDEGPKGEKGDQGIQGPKGDKGCQGEKGEQGPKGNEGPKGCKGDIGPQGIQGLTGLKGEQGIQGPKGDKGETGLQGIQGIQGAKGDVGPKGAKGDIGPQGIQGLTGLKGEQGIQGPKGDKGETGLQGIQGLTGLKGEQGIQGPKGDKGETGLQGLQGIQGPRGDIGPKGDKGNIGPQGIQGIAGPQGIQGVKGDTGLTGPMGPQGATGPKGDPGCSCGVPGPVGPQGQQGNKGDKGEEGKEGKSGSSICPCEITFGKVIKFLLDNTFNFDITTNAPFVSNYSSTDESPASFYNTWGVEFNGNDIVPLCKIESINLSFSSENEQQTFINLLSPVLAETLSCCHSCGSCEVCPQTLLVDEYNGIVSMPSNCEYEYYLSSECNCVDSKCDTIAKRIDLCNFTNSDGEKLRGIIEKKLSENNNISSVSTLKQDILNSAVADIELTGLSAVAVSFSGEGTFNVSIICLENVTEISFVSE